MFHYNSSWRSSMVLVFITIFIIASNKSLANTQTDSLKHQLLSSEGIEKMKVLQKICRSYLFVSPDSCAKYVSTTIKLAQELNDIENEANANKQIGYAYFRVGEYDNSLLYFERAQKLFFDIEDYLGSAIITNFIGAVYYQKSDYSKAISYFVNTEKSCDTLIHNDSIQSPHLEYCPHTSKVTRKHAQSIEW